MLIWLTTFLLPHSKAEGGGNICEVENMDDLGKENTIVWLDPGGSEFTEQIWEDCQGIQSAHLRFVVIPWKEASYDSHRVCSFLGLLQQDWVY